MSIWKDKKIFGNYPTPNFENKFEPVSEKNVT